VTRRPAARVAVLLAALVVLAGPSRGAAGGPDPVERTAEFFVARVPGPFDDALAALQEAVRRLNYTVTGVNDLDDTLAQRAADVGGPPLPYKRYKIVGFCNLTFADEAIRVSPHVAAFMPCRAVLYREPGASRTTIVMFRPSFLAAGLGDAGLVALMRRVEADMLAILQELTE
jgi:uncharacterized protein (DUF302 family)